LVAFGYCGMVGQQARRRAELAGERLRLAENARQGLDDASEEAEVLAATRVQALAALVRAAEEKLAVIADVGARAELAAKQAQAAAGEAALLAGVRTPADVAGLASPLRAAHKLLAQRTRQRDAADPPESPPPP